jgi:hypothetical protein
VDAVRTGETSIARVEPSSPGRCAGEDGPEALR